MSSPFQIPEDVPENASDWTPTHVVAVLRANHNRFMMDDDELQTFKDHKATGEFLMSLKKHDLRQPPWNIKAAPAALMESLGDSLRKRLNSGELQRRLSSLPSTTISPPLCL